MARHHLLLDIELAALNDAIFRLERAYRRDPVRVRAFLTRFPSSEEMVQVRRGLDGKWFALPAYELGEFLAQHG